MANFLCIFCLNCCFSTLWVLKLSSANTERRYHRLNDHAEWKSHYLKRQLFVKLALQVVKRNRRKVNRLSVVVSSRQTLSSFQDIWPEVTSFTSCFKYLHEEEKKKKQRHKRTFVRSSRQSIWQKGKLIEISFILMKLCFHLALHRQPDQQHMHFILSLSLSAFIYQEKDQVFLQ